MQLCQCAQKRTVVFARRRDVENPASPIQQLLFIGTDPVTKDNIMGFELPGCPIKADIPGHLLRAANIQAGRNLKRILHLCQSPLQVTLHPT